MSESLELKIENTSEKLIGLPKIIYHNSDEDTLSKKYIEEQFSWWGVKNYYRYEKKYNPEDYDDWKDLILNENLVQTPEELSLTLNILQSIIDWYDSEESETCIFMQDFIDFSLVGKWFFDWKFLEKNLPYNWDCIQMFCSAPKKIKMHLSPWEPYSGSCHCFMVTRYFAKKLKHYHYKDGKFILHYPTPNKSIPNFEYGSLHRFFYDIGITYTLPIFSLNVKLINEDDVNYLIDKISSESIEYWWNFKSKNYSNFEFFHYNKEEEWKMEVMFDVNSKNPNVYKDKYEGLLIWI